jgi:hypothetical protein
MAVAISRTANPAGVPDDGTVDHVTLYSGVAIGATASDRMIVVAIGKEAGAVGTVFPFSAALDVGGVVYDLVQIGSSAEFGAMGAYLWRTQAFVTAGTTADLYVAWAAAVTAVQNNVAVYRITGAALTPSSQGVNTSTDMDATAPLTTGSRTIAADGGMLAVAAGSSDTNAKTWAQLTEDLDVDAGAFRMTVAFSTTAGTATRTCTGGANGEDGALAWAIFAPGAKTLAADSGSFAVSGTAASLEHGRKLSAAAGSFSFSGTAATLTKATPLVAGSGSFLFSGTAATLRATRLLSAGAGSYAFTGTAASLEHGWRLSAETTSFAFSGTAATFFRTYRLTAETGGFAFGGTAASLEYGRLFSALSGSYSFSGSDATLTKAGAGQTILAADGGSFAFSGSASLLTVLRKVIAESAIYVVTGQDATLTVAPVVAEPTPRRGGATWVYERRKREREEKSEREQKDRLERAVEEAYLDVTGTRPKPPVKSAKPVASSVPPPDLTIAMAADAAEIDELLELLGLADMADWQ